MLDLALRTPAINIAIDFFLRKMFSTKIGSNFISLRFYGFSRFARFDRYYCLY